MTIELIVALVAAIFAVLLFLDIATEAKLLLILVLVVVALLDFVALVGLIDRWRARWRSFIANRSIQRHPELISELYRLHDRITTVLYRRESGKYSLALTVADLMSATTTRASSSSGGKEFTEKFDMVQRHFNWISRRVNDHRTGGMRWKSPEFANTLREIGDHFLMVDDVLQTVYRDFPKDDKGHFRIEDLATWERFREEYAALLNEWREFTERFDEIIKYGAKTTIPVPPRLG